MTRKMAVPGLESMDGHILDGLEFCSRAYAAFDEIRNGQGGIEELRMRKTPRAKKMVEEVLPLARYVQARYGPGFRMRIRWRGGNQSSDAYLNCFGAEVVALGIPSRQFLEVTTAVHPHEYLAREHLNESGLAYAPRSTYRDRKSRVVISKPSVFRDLQLAEELLAQVRSAIQRKSRKRYPRPISLLIQCVVTAPILDDEWSYVVQGLQGTEDRLPFREVILLEPIGRRFTTVYFRRPKLGSRSKFGRRRRSAAVDAERWGDCSAS